MSDAELIRFGESGPSMTHAWLITGPPGSGRSTAAACFAAALVCPEDGCGVCEACRTAPYGGHADVDMVTTETLSYSAEEARDLVLRSAMSPIKSPWHVIVMEDADRLTDRAVNVLLKSLEEPPPSTVWVLCAPSVEDVLPTIVLADSACPAGDAVDRDVTDLLVDHYDIDTCARLVRRARIAGSHRPGSGARPRRAGSRATAGDHARSARAARRAVVLQRARRVCSPPRRRTPRRSPIPSTRPRRRTSLAQFGEGAEGTTRSRIKKMADSETKKLDKRQRLRRTRTVRDQVDRALLDLMGLYRDVLVIQVGGPVSAHQRGDAPSAGPARRAQHRERHRPPSSGARPTARKQIEANVTPQLALESLMVELKDPWIRLASA